MTKAASMSDAIQEALKQDIINRVYSGDVIITELEIAQKYHVSKTPAREALNNLCQEGFLEKIPRKGYFVKKLSHTELKNLFQFRSILEIAVAELCARMATPEDIRALEEICREGDALVDVADCQAYNEVNNKFHIALAAITRNPYLVSAVTNTLQQMCRTMVLDMKNSSARDRLESHKPLVDAIRRHNVEEAKEHIRWQLADAQRRIYEGGPSYWG